MISHSTGFAEFVASLWLAILLAGKFDTRVAFHEDTFRERASFIRPKGEVDDGDDTGSLNAFLLLLLSSSQRLLIRLMDRIMHACPARSAFVENIDLNARNEIFAMGKKNFIRINFLLQRFFRSDPLGSRSRINDNRCQLYPICGRWWIYEYPIDRI